MKKLPKFVAGYKVLKDQKLIIEFRSGLANLKSLQAYKLMQVEDKELNFDFDYLSDTSDLAYDLLIDEGVEEYRKFRSELRHVTVENRKVATITKTPHQIAYAQKLQKQHVDLSQDSAFFKDMNDAVAWLGRDISAEDVLEIVADIKKNPTFIWKG